MDTELGFYGGGGGEKKQIRYKRDVGRKVARKLRHVDARAQGVEESDVQLKIVP